MVYTLGLRSAYRIYREEAALSGQAFCKQGRTEDYEGGSVFPNVEAAVAYRDKNRPNYAIWSVEADWNVDTAVNLDPSVPYRDLIRNARLVKEVA